MLGTLAALATPLTTLAVATNAHHKPVHHTKGCKTHACDVRVGRAWYRKHRPPLFFDTATASYYNDAAGTACGTHYPLGFAHKTLACGTRVRFCAQTCATGTVDDRGPFIAGREFDLNEALKDTIGAPDLGTVRYHVMR